MYTLFKLFFFCLLFIVFLYNYFYEVFMFADIMCWQCFATVGVTVGGGIVCSLSKFKRDYTGTHFIGG